jgi:hypothetical protein
MACTRPALWAPLARLLAAHLSCARVDTPAHVTALLALLDDLADVAEAGCEDPAGDSPFLPPSLYLQNKPWSHVV